MTKSPLFNFCAGIVAGGMLATLIVLHIVTGQVQAHTQFCVDSVNSVKDQSIKTVADVQAEWQKAVDVWKSRAELCEVKTRYSTVIYEYRPGTAIPVLHGAFSITLGSERNHPPADLKPVWIIPAQVPVYTTLDGASYEWIENKSGISIGRFPAVPPPTTEAPQ
jgi:hypothetical protein